MLKSSLLTKFCPPGGFIHPEEPILFSFVPRGPWR